MPLSPVPIGIVFSSSGPYEKVARPMLAGSRLAVAEVNAEADLPVTFHPIEINPAGVPDAYCRRRHAAAIRRAEGRRAFRVGSNYIWAWENNRVLRENLLRRGGSVVAERYCVVGETDFEQIISATLDAMPSFVFTR